MVNNNHVQIVSIVVPKGGGNIPGIANIHYSKKMKLMRNLSMLEYDFVLLDLGAGASYNVVHFVLVSQQSLLVTTLNSIYCKDEACYD